jgi:hypothetical protein
MHGTRRDGGYNVDIYINTRDSLNSRSHAFCIRSVSLSLHPPRKMNESVVDLDTYHGWRKSQLQIKSGCNVPLNE